MRLDKCVSHVIERADELTRHERGALRRMLWVDEDECTVLSAGVARQVVAIAMHNSQWFEVCPLPDDQWRILVKKGEGDWMKPFDIGEAR